MLRIKFVFIYFGLILLSSITITNCSEDNIVTPVPVDSSDFRYPFQDGSSWSYTVTISVSDIRPDSIRHYFTDYPVIITGRAKILYDTVINSVITKCFTDEFLNNGALRTNRFYYINNDTALILYASRQQSPASGILPLRKIKSSLNISDNDYPDKLYDNEIEVLNDSLYSTLKYPMRTGTAWTNYFPSFNFSNVHKYLGFENVNVYWGNISCMKELTTISNFPNIFYYNYYSKSGLIKTHWFLDDIAHTTVYNPDGDGTSDITSEVIITSFNIPSD